MLQRRSCTRSAFADTDTVNTGVRCPVACGVDISPAAFFAALALLLLIYSLATNPI
jgi:hypothetical protein